MTCALCEKGGEPFRCHSCGWEGTEDETRKARPWQTMHSFFCPECNDEQDMDSLQGGELAEAYSEECPGCPEDDDVHVYPFGTVPEANGEQPEHDLRGLGCWCNPYPVKVADEGRRLIVHKAVTVS